MKLLLPISLFISSVISDINDNDVCVWGPGAVPRKGGIYEYEGDYNGKPYYIQRDCIRTFFNGLQVAGGLYLFSMTEDDGVTQRYHIGYELGVINPTTPGLYPSDIYCNDTNINHPSECQKWVNTHPRNNETFTVIKDGCPDIFKENIMAPVLEGFGLEGPEAVGIKVLGSGIDDIDGDYNIKFGLNMFKKETLSSDGNAVYLYFDPYYFQWKFISGFDRDNSILKDYIADPYNQRDPTDDEWKGIDSDIFTCPIYASLAILESSWPLNYIPPTSETPYNAVTPSNPKPFNPSWETAFGPWYDAKFEWYFNVYFYSEGESKQMNFRAIID